MTFLTELEKLNAAATDELDAAHDKEKFGLDSAVSKFHALLTHNAPAIAELVRAAQELVELKRMHDVGENVEEYGRRKPLAWDALRKALAALEGEPK